MGFLSLKHMNHILDLNYDTVIDKEKIERALKAMNELQDELISVHNHYITSDEYIDDECFETIGKTIELLSDIIFNIG